MGRKPQPSSTSYSHARYAHPFFVPAPPAEREPVEGNRRMTDWLVRQTGPIPQVRNDGRVRLADIIGEEGVKEILDLGEIRFHALGDSGVGHAEEAEQVADDMAGDYRPDAGALNPAFLFHLGDIIYGPEKEIHYGERFYRPYRHYPGKIIAIPGNHDGEVRSRADEPSLGAFLANFCSTVASVPDQAADSGIYRQTMTQPGVYWLLDAPFARIIGLYSNKVENPGFLEGDGGHDRSQLKWLSAMLKTIAHAREKKALVIAVHHPPYSQGSHGGSVGMSLELDHIFETAGLWPDLVLSAHSHNYQRYTRRVDGKHIPYLVAGTGGMPPQRVTEAQGQPAPGSSQTTYDAAVSDLGYLFVSISAHQIKAEFWQMGSQYTSPADRVVVDLVNHARR